MTIRRMLSSRISAILIPIVLLLAAAVSGGPAAGQTAATFGQTYQGTLASAGQVDAYTLAAQSGDVLVARMAKSSGTFYPRIRLFSPTGTEVFPTSDSSPKDTSLATFRATATTAGTFTFRLDDGFNGTLTGSYGFFVQRTRNPVGAVTLDAGATILGSIDTTAEMDTYTLPLKAGDVLVARLSRASGNLWPLVQLYSPNGSPVTQSYSSTSSDMEVTVSTEGTYTLLVGDNFRGNYTGAYGLFVQRANRPENAVPLALGQSELGSIDIPGGLETYTVTIPSSGVDTLALRMRTTYGKLWPRIRVYSDEGYAVGDAYNTSDATLSLSVAPGRTYTIFAGDGFNGTFTGGYRLMSLYTMPDVLRALNIAAGTIQAGPNDLGRLNTVADGSTNAVTIRDVVQMLRVNQKM